MVSESGLKWHRTISIGDVFTILAYFAVGFGITRFAYAKAILDFEEVQ
jgi:hypothetical protein